jgi:hypothetical protein
MKRVSARKFHRSFTRLLAQMSPGDQVEVTSHGKVVGYFQKSPTRKVVTPNFAAELAKHSYPPEVGDRLLQDFCRSLM